MTATAASSRQKLGREGRLWAAAFTPVVAWIAAQQLDFLLSPWVCATGHRWVLHAVTAVAFAVALAGGAATWRIWKRLPAGEDYGDATTARRRFVATGGLLLTAVFLTAIVALAIPIFLHRPCD